MAMSWPLMIEGRKGAQGLRRRKTLRRFGRTLRAGLGAFDDPEHSLAFSGGPYLYGVGAG